MSEDSQKRRRGETSLKRGRDDDDSDAAVSDHSHWKDTLPAVKKARKSPGAARRPFAKRVKKPQSRASTPSNLPSSKTFGGSHVHLDTDDVELPTQGASPACGAPTEDEAPTTTSPETVKKTKTAIAAAKSQRSSKTPSPVKSTYNLRSGGKKVRWANVPDE